MNIFRCNICLAFAREILVTLHVHRERETSYQFEPRHENRVSYVLRYVVGDDQ